MTIFYLILYLYGYVTSWSQFQIIVVLKIEKFLEILFLNNYLTHFIYLNFPILGSDGNYSRFVIYI